MSLTIDHLFDSYLDACIRGDDPEAHRLKDQITDVLRQQSRHSGPATFTIEEAWLRKRLIQLARRRKQQGVTAQFNEWTDYR